MTTLEKVELITTINSKLKHKIITDKHQDRELSYRLQILHPCLIGISSAGKTTIIKTLFPQARIVDLSLLLSEEVGGLPRINSKKGITQYYLPDWFDSDTIFFEEIDKVEKEKLAPILSLLTSWELHGKSAIDKTFIFACQPDWLTQQLEFDDTLEAFTNRLLFIPVYLSDSFRYIESKYRLQLPQVLFESRPKEVELKKLRIPITPRALNYIVHFIRELRKMYSTDNVIDIANEIFWQFVPDGIITHIAEQLLKITTELTQEEIIELIPHMNSYELIECLPLVQHKLPADAFFYHFIKTLLSVSQDERNILFEKLDSAIREKEEFLSEQDFFEIARYMLLANYVLVKIVTITKDNSIIVIGDPKEFCEVIENSFNEKFKKLANDWIQKLLKEVKHGE